jgi:hypothetical protein
MNSGFNLRTALHVAKRELITGNQYIVVGDGATTICQSRSGSAVVVDLNSSGQGTWDFSAKIYPNSTHGVGTLTTPNLDSVRENYYVPAKASANHVSGEILTEFFDLEVLPVFTDDKLSWSDSIALD